MNIQNDSDVAFDCRSINSDDEEGVNIMPISAMVYHFTTQ